MDQRAEKLINRCGTLFSQRVTLVSRWQEIAEQIYPERADFTVKRIVGDDWGYNLMTGYPALVRRELANSFGTMLRPADQQWFAMSTTREDRIDIEGKRWLEAKTQVMRRAMYDRVTQFTRATKEGDNDYSAFGQCVISVELNFTEMALLFRCWHLRDCAWNNAADGRIDSFFRKWKVKAYELLEIFGKEKAGEEVVKAYTNDPDSEIECIHCVQRVHEWTDVDKKLKRFPYVSVYIDVTHSRVIEETGSWNAIYVVPRWETVSGYQYAYSPATVIGLPDARMLQDMTRVIIEAGEKATSPPMLAVQDAIRSDLDLRAAGVTWVDSEYDERLGEVLRPLTQDLRGLPIGIELMDRVRADIAKMFYLDRLQLPATTKEMTAYEVAQRVQEYIRNALPLFEPVESDYNAALCDITSDILLRNGAFGSVQEIPESLRGQDISFTFKNPLRDTIEKQKVGDFQQAIGIITTAQQFDPSAISAIKPGVMVRDTLEGAGVPADWISSADEMAAAQQAQADAQAQQQLMAGMAQAAQIANTTGQAVKNFSDANAQRGGGI